MTESTSNGGKPFSDRVQEHLAGLKASLDRGQDRIDAANAKAAADLQAMRNEAHAELEAQRAKVEAANAQMKVHLDAKKAEADAKVAEWKAKGEASRLAKRAEDAEAHAIESLYDARVAIEKAVEAVIDAAIAHLDAADASKKAADLEVSDRETAAKGAPES